MTPPVVDEDDDGVGTPGGAPPLCTMWAAWSPFMGGEGAPPYAAGWPPRNEDMGGRPEEDM